MNRRFFLWCVMALLVAGPIVGAAGSFRIVPIMQVDEVLVSFELADAYTREIREAIASGLRTSFTYDVELRVVGPLWVDRTIASVVASTSDQYDNLTRRHSLSRTVDGHVEEASVTEDDSVVARWLTAFVRLPLCKTSQLDPSRDYYVRISARSRPQGASLLGWASSITGRARFTFIP
jgi:hypothetical protein